MSENTNNLPSLITSVTEIELAEVIAMADTLPAAAGKLLSNRLRRLAFERDKLREQNRRRGQNEIVDSESSG